MNTIKLPFYSKLAFILIIIIATGYLAVIGQELIIPLMFSFLFAILLLPVANFFENKLKLSRSIAAVISVLLLIVFISLIGYILGSQLSDLTSEWPSLKTQLSQLIHNAQLWMAHAFRINIAKQTVYIHNATTNMVDSSGSILQKTVMSLSSMILFIVFIVIYTLLLLFYRRLLMRFVVALFTEKYMGLIYEILKNIKHIIRKYITGLFFEMTIITIVASLLFWLLGVDYVFLMGLFVGILNVIPYIGIFTALILNISITFATSDGTHTLYVAIAIVCIHLVDSNFLMPKIVGSQVKINPLIVIIGVIIGEMLWGISGMFLSIPYLAIAKVIFDRTQGLQPWGILLGEEEHTPKKVKRIIEKVKEKED